MLEYDAGSLRSMLHQVHGAKTLPDANDLSEILGAVMPILIGENPVIRPRDSHGYPGGLLLLPGQRTTIIVPDLHARTGYLIALLDMRISGMSILEALLAGRVQIVCVGDGFHSEVRCADRWYQAWAESKDDYRHHDAMDEEMTESLSLMSMVMLLKTAAPDGFHFLKGNHENVANINDGGNRSFFKFVSEGQMVKDWFLKFLGPEMLLKWVDFESSLPLLAVGDHFMVSHAEPRRPYSREELIEFRGNDQLIVDFTWTGNGEAGVNSVETMLTMYLGDNSDGSVYFGGHRPIHGLYRLRANGRFVQIHNPEAYIAVILESGRKPSPQRDIQQIRGDGNGSSW